MSAQTSMEDSPAGPAEANGASGALRALGLAAVCLGVAVLAAATFVLSYAGIRAIALQGGIEPRYARGYPLLIDAMLVIVLAAVLALRGAGLPSRLLAWLTLLVVLAAAAGADALHATGRTLAHNTAAITAAVLPWALVFLAFVLLLTMLRHARLRRQATAPSQTVPPPLPVAPLALPAAPLTARPLRPEPAQPDAGQQSQRPPDLSHLDLGQPDLIAPVIPQQGPAEPTGLPVRTPQPWRSASIVPGFSRHLASATVADAAEVDAPESDLALEAEERADEPGGGEPAFSAAASDWAGYNTLAESPAESDDTELPEDTEPAEAELPDTTQLADSPLVADIAELADGTELADSAVADPADLVAGEPDADYLTDDEPASAFDDADAAAGEAGPDSGQAIAGTHEPADEEDMPVFHRMWSSPTPPDS